jgi:hypothetical protein
MAVIVALGFIPLIVKVIELLQLIINERRFNLLKSFSQLAINQVNLLEELDVSKKKELAIATVRRLNDSFGASECEDRVLEKIIEGVLWSEDQTELEDEDEEYDD